MKSKISVFLTIVLVAALVAGGYILVLLHEREMPQIALAEKVGYIGLEKEIGVVLTDAKSGIRSYTVTIEQNGAGKELATETFPRQGYYRQAGAARIEKSIRIEAQSLGMKEGPADLLVTVQDFSFWNFLEGNTATERFPVVIDTSQPKIRLIDLPRYITGGGSSIVIYQVNEAVSHHGAIINGNFYAGVPYSPKDELKFAVLIALPQETEAITEMYLSATDQAGNTGKVPFSMVFRRNRPTRDQIALGDSFFASKIPEFMGFYPEITGNSDLERFLYVNGQMRRDNEAKIKEITSVATPERFWKGILGRLPRASKRAGFAEYRTYLYNQNKVDDQVHLGIDLASVRHAPVPAANSGKVVFADYLGIYGSMVIIDHGWGLYTLYSHLSQIKVAEGDMVAMDQEIGNTGNTGMAGGDHLHFSVLVNGVFVNPLEWWDEQWVQLNILSFI